MLVPQKWKNAALLAVSLIFYAWGEPVYVILLLLSILWNYFCGRDLEEKRAEPIRARHSLVLAIAVNLLILGFFKYYVLIIESINALVPTEISYRVLSTPIGISFFTLRALSYLIDVYRGEAAQKRPVNVALYLAMFPQMLAGPVDRYTDLKQQLTDRAVTPQRFGNGAMLFISGLAKKAILADSMGLLQEQIMGLQIGTFSVLTAWIGCAAFAFRFYFELSGFGDMAVGLGRMFGFELRRNFNYPYISCRVSEFWKRWNISVALWFQNYVYDPLCPEEADGVLQIRGILITAILTGFWYSAGWQFLWWGVYMGIILVLEGFVWDRKLDRLPRIIQHVYAIVLVFVGWTFFFGENVGTALDYIGVMFGPGASAPADTQALYFLTSHWLLFVVCIIGSSARGTEVIRAVVEVPRSDQGRQVAACIVYLTLFVVSLAFLVTGTGESGMFLQF